MSERYILSYFKSPEQAECVSRKLETLRVIEHSIDRFSRYGDESTEGPYIGILEAADPSSSGMSHGGGGGPTGRDILLTVVVDSHSYAQAISLIEEAGGLV